MKRSKGFTLIELLVVITIIAVLISIGVVSYGSVNKRSRDAKRKGDVEQLRSALEMYRADNSRYPFYCGWVSYTGYWYPMLKQIFEPTYMSVVPTDPLANGNYAVYRNGSYFGYMYSSEDCSSTGRSYALWVQLESPSAEDLASMSRGTITTYNTGYGMNYKVVNP